MQNCEFYYNGECRCALDTWDYLEQKDIPELLGRKTLEDINAILECIDNGFEG